MAHVRFHAFKIQLLVRANTYVLNDIPFFKKMFKFFVLTTEIICQLKSRLIFLEVFSSLKVVDN